MTHLVYKMSINTEKWNPCLSQVTIYKGPVCTMYGDLLTETEYNKVICSLVFSHNYDTVFVIKSFTSTEEVHFFAVAYFHSSPDWKEQILDP